jgi:hypothetical protein
MSITLLTGRTERYSYVKQQGAGSRDVAFVFGIGGGKASPPVFEDRRDDFGDHSPLLLKARKGAGGMRSSLGHVKQHSCVLMDPRKSRVVELRFFGGLGIKGAAEVLKVSPDTVMRDCKIAKVWLLRELRGGTHHGA